MNTKIDKRKKIVEMVKSLKQNDMDHIYKILIVYEKTSLGKFSNDVHYIINLDCLDDNVIDIIYSYCDMKMKSEEDNI